MPFSQIQPMKSFPIQREHSAHSDEREHREHRDHSESDDEWNHWNETPNPIEVMSKEQRERQNMHHQND